MKKEKTVVEGLFAIADAIRSLGMGGLSPGPIEKIGMEQEELQKAMHRLANAAWEALEKGRDYNGSAEIPAGFYRPPYRTTQKPNEAPCEKK